MGRPSQSLLQGYSHAAAAQQAFDRGQYEVRAFVHVVSKCIREWRDWCAGICVYVSVRAQAHEHSCLAAHVYTSTCTLLWDSGFVAG